jgi:hypothetical protein
MAQPRIFNITRKFYLKRSQVERAIENCAMCWIEFGVSVRDLTIAEAIGARNQQAANRAPLERTELANIHFQGPTPQNYEMTRAANAFYLATAGS